MNANAEFIFHSLAAAENGPTAPRTPAKSRWFLRYAATATTLCAATTSYALITGARTAVESAGPVPTTIDGVAILIYGYFTLLLAAAFLVFGIVTSLLLALPIATILDQPSVRERRFPALAVSVGVIVLACVAASIVNIDTHALDDVH